MPRVTQETALQQETATPSLRTSFFRAVGLSMKYHKLGTLLVASGLITQEDLDAALRMQKETGEQLGTVLIRQGVVSAVHVYRKLAEQWCLKAGAAGIALMMQTMPTTAHATEASTQTKMTAQFTMAAAAINPAAWRGSVKETPAKSYPALFGSHEVKSADLSAFTKWTTVIDRFESQMKTQASTPRVMMWKSEIQSLKNSSVRAQIEGVNDYINDVRYIEDKNNWGKSDYWATPLEFFSKGGDCEDFAIAKYASLRALGFENSQLRLAIVQDTVKNIPHAVLIVYTDEGTFILDNQNKRAEKMDNIGRYQPIFSINSESWWLHKKDAVS